VCYDNYKNLSKSRALLKRWRTRQDEDMHWNHWEISIPISTVRSGYHPEASNTGSMTALLSGKAGGAGQRGSVAVDTS
jgi:hypothetical protein